MLLDGTLAPFLYASGLEPLEATGASTAGAMRLGIGVVLATALAYLRADNGASSVNFRDVRQGDRIHIVRVAASCVALFVIDGREEAAEI